MAEPKKNKKWNAFKSALGFGKSKSTPCKKVDVKKKAAHYVPPPPPPPDEAFEQLQKNPSKFLKKYILEVAGSYKEGGVHSMKFYYLSGRYWLSLADGDKYRDDVRFRGLKDSIDVDIFDIPMLKGSGLKSDIIPDFNVKEIKAVHLKKDSLVSIMSTTKLTGCSFITQLHEDNKGVEYLCAHIQPRSHETKNVDGNEYYLGDPERLQDYIKDHGRIDTQLAGKMLVWGPQNYCGYGGRPKEVNGAAVGDCSTVIGFLDKINNKWDIYFQIWNPSKEIVAVERLETLL